MMPGVGLNPHSMALRAGKTANGGASFDQVYNMGVNSLKSSVSEPFQVGGAQAVDANLKPTGVRKLVNEVDQKSKHAEHLRMQVLSGASSNMHQAMIASQEAGVSFSLLVEMRNKLLETYQELMRLQV